MHRAGWSRRPPCSNSSFSAFAARRAYRLPSTPRQRLKPTLLGHSATHSERLFLVESECGAVAVGRTYLLPPLSCGGASLVQPWLRFHVHRVTGGGHPPPVPTERGVRMTRTNALRQLLHSTASACSSEYGRRSLGVSNGVRSLIWLKASQVRRRPAQLRLHNIRRQQRSTTRYTLTRLRRFPATPY